MSNLDISSSDSEASPPSPVESVKKGKPGGKGRPSRQKNLPSKYKDTLNDKEELECDLSSESKAFQ